MADSSILLLLKEFIESHWEPETERSFSVIPDASVDGFSNNAPAAGTAPGAKRSFPGKVFGSSKKKKASQPVKTAEEARPEYVPEDDLCASECFGISYLEDAAERAPLEERLKYLDESFSQMLLRKIDEAGIKDSECYNRANINRALFNKIKNDPYYRTSKETAVALGLALRLKDAEFRELLSKAGYALSNSSKFDVIIDFCLQNGIYSIMDVNELLFEYDQKLLGSN